MPAEGATSPPPRARGRAAFGVAGIRKWGMPTVTVEVSGFEPPTSTLRTWRSAELSYTPGGRARIAEAPVVSSGLGPATTPAPPACIGTK